MTELRKRMEEAMVLRGRALPHWRGITDVRRIDSMPPRSSPTCCI